MALQTKNNELWPTVYLALGGAALLTGGGCLHFDEFGTEDDPKRRYDSRVMVRSNEEYTCPRIAGLCRQRQQIGANGDDGQTCAGHRETFLMTHAQVARAASVDQTLAAILRRST